MRKSLSTLNNAQEHEYSQQGKAMAVRSSGPFIPSGIYLAITLRWLSVSHFLDLEDLYGVQGNNVFKIIWKTVEVLETHLVMETFDPWDLVNCRRFSEKMFQRSQQTFLVALVLWMGCASESTN